MTDVEKVTLAGLCVGFALSVVGLAVELGVGWAGLWAGLLVMAGALTLDARSE